MKIDMNPPTEPLCGPVDDNTAMSLLLEQVRDNPGAISPYAAVGAARWALGRIAWLEMVIRAAREDVLDSPDDAPHHQRGAAAPRLCGDFWCVGAKMVGRGSADNRVRSTLLKSDS